MAKINIAGEAIIITSALKLEDIELLAKYRPKALTLYGGEDGKEPLFKVVSGEGTGYINANGAVFSRASGDGSGLACITMFAPELPEDAEEAKVFVEEQLGGAILLLNKLEASVPAIVGEVQAEKAAIRGSITVLQ